MLTRRTNSRRVQGSSDRRISDLQARRTVNSKEVWGFSAAIIARKTDKGAIDSTHGICLSSCVCVRVCVCVFEPAGCRELDGMCTNVWYVCICVETPPRADVTDILKRLRTIRLAPRHMVFV